MVQGNPEFNAAKANLPFRILRAVGRGLFGLLFHIRVEGLDRVPRSGPYVLACNHLSWIDPLIVMSQLPPEPRVHFLAAVEYTTGGPWIVRQIVKAVGGVIPVDRESHKGDRQAIVQSLKVLKGHGVLGIFPEGKCGMEEGALLPLKDGAATFAAKTGCPIQVLGMSGTYELFYRKRIHIRVGPLLEPREGESPADLLDRLAEAMAQNMPPLDPEQPKVKRMAWLSKLF